MDLRMKGLRDIKRALSCRWLDNTSDSGEEGCTSGFVSKKAHVVQQDDRASSLSSSSSSTDAGAALDGDESDFKDCDERSPQQCGRGQEAGHSAQCTAHWRVREAALHPSKATWNLQDEVTPLMRHILVEWIFEVCQEFNLVQETFLLTISNVDRYLSVQKVSRRELQLVGVTCLWVSAKYEEVHPPTMKHLLGMTDNAYRAAEMSRMEIKILTALGFQVAAPTTRRFLEYYAQMADVRSPSTCLLATHLLDLATLASAYPSAHFPRSSFEHHGVSTTQAQMGMPAGINARLAVHTAPVQHSIDVQQPHAQHFMQNLSDSTNRHTHGVMYTAVPSSLNQQQSPPSDLHYSEPPPSPSLSCSSSSLYSSAVSSRVWSPEPSSSSSSSCLEAATSAAAAVVSSMADCLLLQQDHALSSLASALPSRLAAAALFLAMAVHKQYTPRLPAWLAGLAHCSSQQLLDLAQALQQLQASLCSGPSACGMLRQYQGQKQLLVYEQLARAKQLNMLQESLLFQHQENVPVAQNV